MNPFQEQVTQGIEFLDFYYGRKNWLKKIDPDTLDLNRPCNCVLGQVEVGGYYQTAGALCLNRDDCEAFGFCVPIEILHSHGGMAQNYKTLTLAWKEAIDRLRGEET